MPSEPAANASVPIVSANPADIPPLAPAPPSAGRAGPPSSAASSTRSSTPTLLQPDEAAREERKEASERGGKSRADPVDRRPTRDTVVAPPYTIYSTRMRWFIVSLVSFAGLFSPLSANIYFPVIPAIASNLGVTTEKINISVTVYMILQGISPSFFGAICDVLGRRPVYILTFLIYLGACAGLANTHKYWLLVFLRAIQAAGSASVIAIGSGSIGDIAPPSERGMFMSLFGLGPMVGPAIGPVAGGLLAQAYNWQALFWFLLAFGAVTLFAIILFLPETLRSLVGNGSIPARGLNRSLISIIQDRRRARNADADAVSVATVDMPPKKGWKDVRPFAPLKMFKEKDVFLVLTFNSACYTLFYTITTSTGSTFKTTYHLNETDLGLCFIANGVGCLLASFLNGPRMTADYKAVAMQVEKEKEMKRAEAGIDAATEEKERKKDLNDLSTFPIEKARLRSLPYYFAVLIACSIVYGWVLDKGVHLSVPLIMQFFVGISVTSIFNMISTLVVDLYPGQSASATAANNLYRCLCGAAGTAFVDPLINKMGAGWAFTFLSLLNCCFLPIIFLEWKYGMGWRLERGERIKREQEREAEKKKAKLAKGGKGQGP
ncbi:hypothetical protein JCM21900_006723 [Sporobolomyces salmonicolor]